MKRKFIHIVATLLLLLSSKLSMAYTGVYIPDANFRNFLFTSHPTVLYADKSLNTTAAAALNTPFKCYAQNVTDLSGIEYFTNITTLEVKYNMNLKTLPNISGLIHITTLGLDSNALTALPDLSSLTALQVLSFHHNQVSVIPNLSNLTQLTILFAYVNNISVLPDLSALVNLDKLHIANNPISVIPSLTTLTKLTYFACHRTNITTIPSLSACPLLQSFICNNTSITALPNLSNCAGLQYLICNNNNIGSLPDISNCTGLIQLKVASCGLSSIPNLTIYPSLNLVSADNNFLSFEDILPSVSHPNFSSFTFTGQTPGTVMTDDAINLSPASINLVFDQAINNSVYQWYKDGVAITSTTANALSFSSVTFADAGVYTSSITNATPALAGITLISKAITLRVSPCILSNNLNYTIENATCSYPILVVIDETSFSSGTAPYSYKVANSKDTLRFNSSTLALKTEGTFDLIVTDATGCNTTFNSKLVIPRNEQCDPVFYPNGDGVADTYYIENSGQAQIYNRAGELIQELNVPANWDGNTKKGDQAPTGLYVIVVNKDTTIRVTLLR